MYQLTLRLNVAYSESPFITRSLVSFFDGLRENFAKKTYDSLR